MGGASSEQPPAGMDLFAWNLSEHRADIFLAYCSARTGFIKNLSGASVFALPPVLATGADYGLTVLAPRNEHATGLALFILSQAGQAILARNGFTAPLLTDQPP
jgi:molybdate transport system substrate-binding protein